MTHYELNGVNYFVDIQGDGEPLLLLHGFTGNHQSWQTVADAFKNEYQLIMPDLIGHGQTDAPTDANRYTMDKLAEDIITLLDTLNIEKTNLLGYSMGGRVAVYLAVHFPERINKLILESTSAGLITDGGRTARRFRDNRLADRIEAGGLEAFVNFWERIPLWKTQENLPIDVKNQQRAIRMSHTTHGLANSLRGMGTGVQPNLWDDLEQLSMPICLIVGEKDRKFHQLNQYMHQLMKNAQLHIMDNCGHTVHLESPNTYIELIYAFLHDNT